MSKKVYCVAQFQPKEGKLDELFAVLQALEPNTLREDGCLQYVVTRHRTSPFAGGESYPIAFHEIWASNEACQRQEIADFFQQQCVAESGLVEKSNVAVYTDEPNDFKCC